MEPIAHSLVPLPASHRSAVDDAVARIRDLDLATQLREQRDAAQQKVFATSAELSAVKDSYARAVGTSQAFDRALARVYVDPQSARTAFEDALGNDHDAAVRAKLRRTMAEDPGIFGTLRTEQRPILFGLLHRDDDSTARTYATHAARLGIRAAVAGEELHQAVGPEGMKLLRTLPDGYTRILISLGVAREIDTHNLQQLDLQRAALPDDATLRRTAAQALRAVLPEELGRVAIALTSPQIALADSLRSIADLAMGRERHVG